MRVKMKNKLFFVLFILLVLPLISADTYGSNSYGRGSFGIGYSGETTTTTTTGGGGSSISSVQFDVKILEIESDLILGDYFDFSYFIKGVGKINNDVTIDFWIEKDNETVSSGSDVIYFGANEEKNETASLLIPEGVESGTYQLKVKATYGSVRRESHRTIQLNVEEGSVKQLFDISFFIEEPIVKGSYDLVLVINFENFGTVATTVDLTYIILDGEGRRVHFSEEIVRVETEKVLRKSFEGLNLPEGKYTFVLETLYGGDVYDEFVSDFEIVASCELLGLDFGRFIFCGYWGILVAVMMVTAFVILMLVKRERRKLSVKKKKGVREYKKKVRTRLKQIKN